MRAYYIGTISTCDKKTNIPDGNTKDQAVMRRRRKFCCQRVTYNTSDENDPSREFVLNIMHFSTKAGRPITSVCVVSDKEANWKTSSNKKSFQGRKLNLPAHMNANGVARV